ncbi:uncharacterized protein LOC116295812 isoform X2 [Actinia tenebrosa]|uniref:Uncharacterized protein LOC116295812 isoform X2 n=1 Tax=Actinia tenebrosa TaxID=6105 RepID=A0A6P8I4A1_ACTTE|nr:uncharacterized protein LOC116295812 isoform X2 [Actinia tenebrosa]
MAALQVFSAWILLLVYVQGSLACKVDFEKVGCYRDVTRPLPELIMTDRDPSDKERYSGIMFDWRDFEGSTRSLICRCAALARSRGYRYIGIQYYAECWSGNNPNFSRDGKADTCMQSYKSFGEVICDFDSPIDCVGEAKTNFVYDLLDCREIVDVAVLLDVSSSMEGQTMNIAKSFLNNLVNTLNISRYGAHIGLITFTHKATLKFTFKNALNKGDSVDGFKNVINNISGMRGSTWPDTALKMADSILFTEEGGSRPEVSRFVITVTDGSLHQDSVITPIMLSLQSRKKVHLMSVGVGSVVNERDLVALALSQRQNVFNGNHGDAAQKVVDRIQDISQENCKKKITITRNK